MFRPWSALLVTGLFLLPFAAFAKQPARLQWVDCWFEPAWGRELRCAHFFPSRVEHEPETRLPVVRIRASKAVRQSSPLLYLPGGPGLPAGLDDAGLQRWLNWMDIARWPHDLVLFDPRGTGLSVPRRDCPEIRARDQANLMRPLSASDDLRNMQQTAEACFNRLHEAGFRPEDYSGPRQVRDVVELMQVMDSKKWNLYGISYGSRLALQVLRQAPDRIRSLVLDSVYPPEVNGLLSRPAQFARARDGLLDACAADAHCQETYPVLARQLNSLFRQLSRKPQVLRVEHWPTDRVTSFLLNDYRLMWVLFMESYAPRYRPRLIPAIAAASSEDFRLWPPIAGDFLDQWLDPEFSHAVYLSVTCAEDFAVLTEASYRAEAERNPQVAAYVTDEWRLSPCHRWPVGALPQAYHEPVVSDVPALFLSGVHDAATLPEWSRTAAGRFNRGYAMSFEGSSHGVTWENACAMATAWEFLRNPGDWQFPPCLSEREKRDAIRPVAGG